VDVGDGGDGQRGRRLELVAQGQPRELLRRAGAGRRLVVVARPVPSHHDTPTLQANKSVSE